LSIKEPSPTLIGNKIILRTVDPEKDFKGFYKIFQEPDMHLWTGNTIPTSQEESYQEHLKYRDLIGLTSWTILQKETENRVRTYWIAPSFENGKRVITAEAQRIGKPYWRKGYTKEARNLVYDYVFFDLEVEEVHAQAWKGNHNSCYSMENAGFQLIEAIEKVFPKRQEWMSEHHYRLTKEDWEKRRLHFE
jgi:[ribosomal protein S5]-alanine N-acetyltransferase